MFTAGASRPYWLQALVASVLIVALAALYLVALWATFQYASSSQGAADRDTVYFGIHGGTLVIGGLAGFAAGRWLHSSGVAYSVLVVAALVVLMITAQAGAQTLACHGHNDIVKHWSC